MRDLLSLAPNLRMLVLSNPADSEFNLRFHPRLQMIVLESHGHVKLSNVRSKDKLEVVEEKGSHEVSKW